MAIYIKGMEMPEYCGECPLVEKCKNRHLEITESDNGYEPIFIQDDCPLTEVPEPHGRLIDLDALIDQISIDSAGNMGQYGDEWLFEDTIEKAPTIIERSDK